jgi:hypothetical protein
LCLDKMLDVRWKGFNHHGSSRYVIARSDLSLLIGSKMVKMLVSV